MMEEGLEEVGEKERLEKKIEATDREIDQRVYDLYGLTEEAIEVVEEK